MQFSALLPLEKDQWTPAARFPATEIRPRANGSTTCGGEVGDTIAPKYCLLEVVQWRQSRQYISGNHLLQALKCNRETPFPPTVPKLRAKQFLISPFVNREPYTFT